MCVEGGGDTGDSYVKGNGERLTHCQSTSESTSLLAWDLRSNINICLRGGGICLHCDEWELCMGSLAPGRAALVYSLPFPLLQTHMFQLNLLPSKNTAYTWTWGLYKFKARPFLDLFFFFHLCHCLRMLWMQWVTKVRLLSWQNYWIDGF